MTGQAHNTYLTLGINLFGMRCVVVGGGQVGARKAATLARAGARVAVVSPEIAEPLARLVAEGAVEWMREPFCSGHLDGAALVIAATGNLELNDAIGREAEARGQWYCVTSSGARSRVIFPASVERDGASVAVHTHGSDCRRSQRLRDAIAAWLDEPDGGAASREIDVDVTPSNGAALARIADARRRATVEAVRLGAALRMGQPPSGRIRLGGRSSRLSQVQLREARGYLEALAPPARFDVALFESPGDRDKSTPLPDVTDDDFFTRDLDDALRRGDIDVAVHSAKDLPQTAVEGVMVAAVTPSLAPWDCLVSRGGETLAALPPGAVVGTSSVRRRAQILALRPDLACAEIRGDIPSRLDQLDAGRYDVLVVASVALARLGLQERIVEVFSLVRFGIVPGQGSLALAVRTDNKTLAGFLKPLDLQPLD